MATSGPFWVGSYTLKIYSFHSRSTSSP